MSFTWPNPVELRINGGTEPPLGVVTDNDHGSYVIITTWIFTCVSVLFVGARTVLRPRNRIKRNFEKGTVFICAALLFAIAQSAIAQQSVRYGLGRHRQALSNYQFSRYSTYVYTCQILSIFVFVLSKLSLIIVFNCLTPFAKVKSILLVLSTFIILWGLCDLFSTAFQCGPAALLAPGPRCVNARALYLTRGLVNIASDMCIITLPVFITHNVQIKPQKRMIIIAMFATRLVVCISVGVEMSTLNPYFSGRDPSWNYLNPSVWNQISVHLSVITACIPLMKPFLDSLQSSLVNSGVPRNYQAQLTFGGRSTKTTSRKSSATKTLKPMVRTGLVASTQNAIQGGLNATAGSEGVLADNVIHVQREVDVSVQSRSPLSSGS